MVTPPCDTTRRVHTAFSRATQSLGGMIHGTFDDGTQYFSRSSLPIECEITPGDAMRGGVAIRANCSEVWVHPYLFRTVCTNGAIRAQALQTRHIEIQDDAPWSLESQIEEAVNECGSEHVFAEGITEVRSSQEIQAETLIQLFSLMGDHADDISAESMSTILKTFAHSDEHNGYSLLNTVTAVGRETRNPGLRWRLETLGGAVAAWCYTFASRQRPTLVA